MTETCSYRLTFGIQSDIGKKRKQNEDSVLALPEEQFYCVCDGMGGLLYGKESSLMAIQMFASIIQSHIIENEAYKTATQRINAYKNIFLYAIQFVSNRLYFAGNQQNQWGEYHYGSTFTGVWFMQNQVLFGNLGDSRGYFLDHMTGQFQQVTRDHSLMQMLLDSGRLSPHFAQNFSRKNQIIQFLGMLPEDTKPDIFVKTVHTGDKILLCSDGLTNMVPDEMIYDIICSEKWDTQAKCQHLIQKANRRGGKDNISVILIEIHEMNEKSTSSEEALTLSNEEVPEEATLQENKLFS